MVRAMACDINLCVAIAFGELFSREIFRLLAFTKYNCTIFTLPFFVASKLKKSYFVSFLVGFFLRPSMFLQIAIRFEQIETLVVRVRSIQVACLISA